MPTGAVRSGLSRQREFTLIEGWESNSVLESNGGAWAGDEADFDFVGSSAAWNGAGALRKQQTGTSSNLNDDIDADDPDLNAYATRGDHTRYYIRANQLDGRIIIRFGDGSASQFNFRVRWDNDTFGLYNGGSSLAVNSSIGITANEWLYIDHKWDDGSTFGGSNGDHNSELRRASDDTVISDLGSPTDTEHTGGDFHEVFADSMSSTGDEILTDWWHIRNR